jgi:glycosyltransferase involved in cell wall biosynthesis
MIRFVSNLPRELRTGGFSAMNAAAFSALAAHYEVTFAGPIDPPTAFAEKAVSKTLRLAGAPGDFYFFSERRLKAIAAEVASADGAPARLDFFHGFTPWIATRPVRPYVAWSDCAFADYIQIYHDRARFRAADLDRIETAEARWLSGARRVLFTSDWAAQRAIARYELDASRTGSVGIFGELEPPAHDAYAGAPVFAFVSTNFEAKGGPIVLEAFRRVRQTHAQAKLVIIGAAPGDVAAEPGCTYAGFLRKEVPDELARFRAILGAARAVVHPTKSDIAPLLLVEAGLFGCPAIATRTFAIPELVADGESGLLLDPPADANAVADAMRGMLDRTDEDYARLRAAAWRRARSLHGKAGFERRLCEHVAAALAEPEAAAA